MSTTDGHSREKHKNKDFKHESDAKPSLIRCMHTRILPTTAQITRDVAGEVEATINGMDYRGETLVLPSEGTATAEFLSIGTMTMISIQAHDPDAEHILNNAVSLDISLIGSNASASIMETSVYWWPEGMSNPFYYSRSGEVVIHTLTLDDESSKIAGIFSAVICGKESFFAELDMENCMPIEGAFDTALRKTD